MSFSRTTSDPYVKRQEGGVAGGGFLTNTVAISNLASGGAIGTAAATVDVYGILLLNQTTSGQTVSLPTPTDSTAGKTVIVMNVGSQSVTILSTTVTAGNGLTAVWTGAAWGKSTL